MFYLVICVKISSFNLQTHLQNLLSKFEYQVKGVSSIFFFSLKYPNPFKEHQMNPM